MVKPDEDSSLAYRSGVEPISPWRPLTQPPRETGTCRAFLRGARDEVGKVQWPTRTTLLRQSAYVLTAVLGVVLAIAVLDGGLGTGVFELLDR